MQNIEVYIQSNIHLLSDEEPDMGHFNRFLARLSRERSMGHWLLIARIAAVILAITVVSVVAPGIYRNTLPQVLFFRNTQQTELLEAENFYHDQLADSYKILRHMPFKMDKAEKKRIMKELDEMDMQAIILKRDLSQNPNDEWVVQAIFSYYQAKIDMIDMIINRTRNTTNLML
jgi:hypothetical protein